MRMLAVMDDKRNPEFPDVPTAKEQGVDIVYLMWRGVLAPKGTPRPIVDKLADAFKKMTADKAFVAMLKSFGDVPNFLGPDEFGKLWRAEYELHKEMGKIYKNNAHQVPRSRVTGGAGDRRRSLGGGKPLFA